MIFIEHFKRNLELNLAKLVGNLDIIGNPITVITNLKGGLKQIYEKPKEKFNFGKF